jgi:hypothetical protein
MMKSGVPNWNWTPVICVVLCMPDIIRTNVAVSWICGLRPVIEEFAFEYRLFEPGGPIIKSYGLAPGAQVTGPPPAVAKQS